MNTEEKSTKRRREPNINPKIFKWARKNWGNREWDNQLTKWRELTEDLQVLKSSEKKQETVSSHSKIIKRLETDIAKLKKELVNDNANKLKVVPPKNNDWKYFSKTEQECIKSPKEFSLAIANKVANNYRDWEKQADAISNWEQDKAKLKIKLTLTQIKAIAKKFRFPYIIGFDDEVPKYYTNIKQTADFKTFGNIKIKAPSHGLVTVIEDAEFKQEWYRDYIKREIDETFSGFNNNNNNSNDINGIANDIRNFLNLNETSKKYDIRKFITTITDKDIIVIYTGQVGQNNSWSLDANEFTGFTLYDAYAPLIFINKKAHPSTQIFTLMHELAHVYLKESGIDKNLPHSPEEDHSEYAEREKRCNKIAGRVLLPDKTIKKDWRDFNENVSNIAKKYNLSDYVVLYRAKEAELLNKKEFDIRWKKKIAEKKTLSAKQIIKKYSRGGFSEKAHHTTLTDRLGGKKFVRAVIDETLTYNIYYRETYKLLGLKIPTFKSYANKHFKLGIKDEASKNGGD